MENDVVIPINPKSTLPRVFKASVMTQQKLKLKVKPKGPVMSVMDTLLTLLIVSPLIVGQWRGTWTLMDIYERAFPPWESFLFGGTLHLSFAILREGLQDLIKFKDKVWWKQAVTFLFRRGYTYFFAFACILNWRGGWIVFDEWLGVSLLPSGLADPEGNIFIVKVVFLVCLILLGSLRSFRNILAAPLLIGLDTKNTAFDFPTRFRISISYTAVYAINNNRAIVNNNPDKNTITTRKEAKAEKLTARLNPEVTIEKQHVEHISPRPFVNDLRGASPSGFSPSFGFPTTPSYPQIPKYRIPNQPHNIQDIIQFLSENAHRHKEVIQEDHRFWNPHQLLKERDKFKKHGTNQRNRFSKPHFPQDPFFAYKPQDPSEINLLAPTSFRFAPPVLSSAGRKPPPQILQEAENVINNTENDVYRKPLSLTLNIYPSPFESDFGNGDNRFKFHGPGVTPRYRYPPFLGMTQRNKHTFRPNRMILHLNLFPGAPSVFTDEDDDVIERKFRKRN